MAVACPVWIIPSTPNATTTSSTTTSTAVPSFTLTSTYLSQFIAAFVHTASPKLAACQKPKKVLLPTGEVSVPWPWAPSSVPIQLLQIGDLFIVSLPTELTTMAGRRIRKALAARLTALGLYSHDGSIALAGLTNGYADYTTTYEEYQQQRYEGGSTIFGPWQLDAYIEHLLQLADHLAAGTVPPRGQVYRIDRIRQYGPSSPYLHVTLLAFKVP